MEMNTKTVQGRSVPEKKKETLKKNLEILFASEEITLVQMIVVVVVVVVI